MGTHRRAWVIRAGVVVVVAALGLLGLATPALAAGPNPAITDLTVEPSTINAGQQTTVKFKVKNLGDAGLVTVEVSSNNPKLTCVGTCKYVNVSFDAKDTPGGSKDYPVKFSATGTFTADEQAALTVKAGSAQEQQQITIIAPKTATTAPVASVPEVSGTVVDVFTGTPIDAAKVFIQDSANTNWEIGTDKTGAFKIQSKPDKPIAPGTIAFKVEKTGLQPFAGAGQAGGRRPTPDRGEAHRQSHGLGHAVRRRRGAAPRGVARGERA